MTVKNTIHNLSKRILARDKDTIDIEAAELSSLALYKIYNLPYFNGSNEFLRLHKNIFNEISIGSLNLNNVKGVRNDCMNEFNVLFDKDDPTPEEVYEDRLLRTEKEMNDLKLLKEFLLKSNGIAELTEIIDKHEENDLFFISRIMITMGDERRKIEPIIRALDCFLKYTADDTPDEYEFEFKTKRQLYRKSHISDISESLVGHYDLRNLLFGNKNISEIRVDILDKLTGLHSCSLEDLDGFKNNYPEIYEKSLYKILNEVESREERIKILYDRDHFEKDKLSMLKKIDIELKKESIEELLNKYDKQLDLIIRNTIKKYPELNGEVANSNLEIEVKSYTGEREYYEMVDKIKRESNLEIYETMWGREASYDVVKGLRIYQREWGLHGATMVVLKNGLEEVSILEGDLRDSFRSSSFYENVKIPIIKVNYFHDSGRGVTIENIKDMFKKFIEMTSDQRPILVYDIYDRANRKYVKNDEENTFYKVISQMKKEYPDVIFFNDGCGLECDSIFMKDIKSHMFEYINKNNLNVQEMRKINQKVEEYFKTEDFRILDNKEYFERKEEMETIIEKIINKKITN